MLHWFPLNTASTVNIWKQKVKAAVATYLKAMCQIARGIGEIRFQFQSSPVGSDRLWYVAGVLVYRRQVAVGVGECRVDLYSTSVALHR